MRFFGVAFIVLTGAAIVFAAYFESIDNKYAADRDFIAYWAAGQLLDHGQNPYDFQAVKALEVAAGRNPESAMFMMRNPPDALFIALPLGFTGPRMGMILWLFVMIGSLLLASFMIWRLNGSPDSLFHLLGFAFAPCLACLMNGQCGIFLLLGVVLFLYLLSDWPYTAGVSLLLCALKPHLFLPLGVVLAVWAVFKARSYRVLAGFGTAMILSCALVYVLDRHAWSQYAQMIHEGGALSEPIPALSVELRSLISPGTVWIQFVPMFAACVWAVWYFWTQRSNWNWMDQGLVVLLVGAVCTPYGWLMDEAMVLPAALTGLYRAAASRRSVWPLALFAAAALAELMMNVPIKSRYYLWTTPAWLCWYLYASGRFGRRPTSATG